MIMMRNEEKFFDNEYVSDIEKHFDRSRLREHFDQGTIYNCYSFANALKEQRAITKAGRTSIVDQLNLHQGDEQWILQAEALLYKWFVA